MYLPEAFQKKMKAILVRSMMIFWLDLKNRVIMACG